MSVATRPPRRDVISPAPEKPWRLDDSGGRLPPLDVPEIDRGGGGGVWPIWASHMIAFLLGGITWGFTLLAPPIALLLVGSFVLLGITQRWGWTHVMAFALGAISWMWLLVAPLIAALLVLVGVVGITALAAHRRWH